MDNKVAKAIERAIIIDGLGSIEKNITGCPESVWDMKFGNDCYWQHIFHALASSFGLLPLAGAGMPELGIPVEFARLKNTEDLKTPHTKEMMLDFRQKVLEHVNNYFKTLEDSKLFEEVDFYGHKIPLINKLLIASGHILYHVGICDAALRDNGGTPAI